MDMGTLVSFKDGLATYKDKSDQMWTRPVDPGCSVTVNSVASSLDKLQPGDDVHFSGNPATSIMVLRTTHGQMTAAHTTTPTHTSLHTPAPAPTIPGTKPVSSHVPPQSKPPTGRR